MRPPDMEGIGVMGGIETGGLIIAAMSWLVLGLILFVGLWAFNRFMITHKAAPLLLSVVCVCYLVCVAVGIAKI